MAIRRTMAEKRVSETAQEVFGVEHNLFYLLNPLFDFLTRQQHT